MRSENHANALLVEFLIVIFFFMLGATILMRVFEKSYLQGQEAKEGTFALAEVQSLADRLYESEDPQVLLTELGFIPSSGETAWEKEGEEGSYLLKVLLSEEAAPAGILRKAEVSASLQGEEVLRLPCVRYLASGADTIQGQRKWEDLSGQESAPSETDTEGFVTETEDLEAGS